MVETVTANRDRRLLAAIASLTGVALVGSFVDMVGGFATWGSPGCASPVVILFILIVIFLMFAGLITAAAVAGFALYWNGSQWGPLLMMVANLLLMVFFGWGKILEPGHVTLGIVIVAMAGAAAVSILLLLWPLVSQGSLRARSLKVVLLVALTFVIAPYYTAGLAWDLNPATQSAPLVAAQASGPKC